MAACHAGEPKRDIWKRRGAERQAMGMVFHRRWGMVEREDCAIDRVLCWYG